MYSYDIQHEGRGVDGDVRNLKDFAGFGLAPSIIDSRLGPIRLLNVLNRFSPPDVTYLPDLSQFISFVLLMVIGFGIVFELPVVLFVLGMLRITNSRWLYKRRPYFFLGLGLLANFLTPGADPLTPLIMFIPLYVFFEGTALLLKLLGR